MDPSLLVLLRQSLPDYLVSSLGVAGVTSLDLFLALSDDRSAARDVIPLQEVSNYLREQLPLLSSPGLLRTFLPTTLSAAAQDLETARRLAQHWSFPPGTKCLIFRLQASLKAQQQPPKALEVPPPAPEPPADEEPTPAKLQRLDRSANSELPQDTTVASAEEEETGQKRRRRRKRARRSKNPPVPVPVSTPAPPPVPMSSPMPAQTPVSLPVPTNGPSRLGHVIFDSDGEVREERVLSVPEHTLEVAQNRRTCKSKPNFEFPEMSKKAQLKSRQTNRSFFLKVSCLRLGRGGLTTNSSP